MCALLELEKLKLLIKYLKKHASSVSTGNTYVTLCRVKMWPCVTMMIVSLPMLLAWDVLLTLLQVIFLYVCTFAFVHLSLLHILNTYTKIDVNFGLGYFYRGL